MRSTLGGKGRDGVGRAPDFGSFERRVFRSSSRTTPPAPGSHSPHPLRRRAASLPADSCPAVRPRARGAARQAGRLRTHICPNRRTSRCERVRTAMKKRFYIGLIVLAVLL